MFQMERLSNSMRDLKKENRKEKEALVSMTVLYSFVNELLLSNRTKNKNKNNIKIMFDQYIYMCLLSTVNLV